MTNGEVKNVFLAFSSIDGKLARLHEFKIGNSYHGYSGTLLNRNEMVFNENNDYIPGGEASYNLDMHLKLDGKNITGFYKEYHFDEGKGGFNKSKPDSMTAEGVFDLRSCRVIVVDQ